MVLTWHPGLMADTERPSLDDLVAELALVREAGLDPLDVEPLLTGLPELSALGVVRHESRTETSLARAQSICAVVRHAAERLASDEPPSQPGTPPPVVQAQYLFRTHYKTQALTSAEARVVTREASGLEDRQYRRRQEPRLLRLIAQAVLELDREDDLHQWGRALEVGAEVPQTVALYWLNLFRDHYFRMETSAFAMQFDYATALSQHKDGLPSWQQYLATAVYWNVEFSYLRHRFFRNHGPLWFAPTDEGCTKLNDAVERIEYHDPFPDEYMAKLRRLYGGLPDPDHDAFTAQLAIASITPDPIEKAEGWLGRCTCSIKGQHTERCEIGLVLANCDIFGDTVEEEFTRIQEWYRNPRFAVQADLHERILSFRTPGRERDM